MQDISGAFTYGYVVCKGAVQSAGEDVSYIVDGSFRIDASDDRKLELTGNVGGVLTLYTRGGVGIDEENAGAGGSVRLSNAADMTLEGSRHAGFYQSLISASSIGGNGDDHNDDNNSDGGDGGAGRSVDIESSGDLIMASTLKPDTASGYMPLFGISAVSGGGTGGDQNDSIFDNQVGGPGGAGGPVNVSNHGRIQMGTEASRITGYVWGAGIQARSSGGEGGPDNGAAGAAGVVNVVNTGDIVIGWKGNEGKDLFGIHAISEAGEGSESKDRSDDGGAGGNAGEVTVRSGGTVFLSVDSTTISAEQGGAGIAGRSKGGKGGLGPDQTHTGGKGGTGGAVTVTMTGAGSRVTTRGPGLTGVLAQSVGGEGGGGKSSVALAGEGGGAGFGGNAGTAMVSIEENAFIETDGPYSPAIIAQSVGGGGGTGGDFVSVLGGQAGNGGNGGDASYAAVNTSGSLLTRGHHAYGVLVQSIAGSGGSGGVDASVSVALGGDGAGGGAAGTASLVQAGEVSTSGYAAHGMVAQSIGGGGGAAGGAIGLISVGGNAAGAIGSQGGEVAVTNVGQIRTEGPAAIGMVAQSIGGGGGSGGDTLGVLGVGGSGASGGNGGYVGVYDIGVIETSGHFSPGVLAQSIGGGGGNGGDTISISLGVNVAVGGSGAAGGDGGAVCLSSQGRCADSRSDHVRRVTTAGAYSPGIIAQNIGGGGGSGGSVRSASAVSVVGMQLGGSGDGGGHAGADGTVIHYQDLEINTAGTHAPGILAQSIGGGGGSGGDASYYNAALGFNAALTMGGSAAKGGSGARTEVILEDSRIGTGMGWATADRDTYAPNDASGVVAQTIGGGGGNGGNASATTFIVAVPLTTPLPPVSLNLQTVIGGSGGAGGSACLSGDSNCLTRVALKGSSAVTTLGDGSNGVLVQSIGGGGGNGGDASALSIGMGYGDAITGAAVYALGGTGSRGASGGRAELELGNAGAARAVLPDSLPDLTEPLLAEDSSILTYGDFANGALVQSIGGGGGTGGPGASNAYSAGGLATIAVTMGLGGTGGDGGNGGFVTATQHPDFVIHTMGSGARGILAQSIGGGGGTSQGGTMALSGGVKSYRGSLRLNLGREGGSGGDGARVSASLDGAIRTEGADADGVLLQSLGGGGGLGGSAGADASSRPVLDRIGGYLIQKERFEDDGAAYEFTVSLGGQGGEGGLGGDVDFDFGGRVATQGDWADGLVAQSIGGGGGAGGSSTASGSRVMASIRIAVGGEGGEGGHGGAVNARFDSSQNHSISTEGYAAHGVLLQSIGGGGGLAGDGSDSASGSIMIGGSDGGKGGTGGRGGSVVAGSGGGDRVNISTAGWEAPAFVAQSIGGGGGIAGAGNSDATLFAESHSLDIAVGGRGGSANHGGTVDVQLGADVATLGRRAHGFVIQSIGGGGGMGGAGNAGEISSVDLGGRGGAGGDGGTAFLLLSPGSTVVTQGDGAHAVIVQSVGGGGGVVGDSTEIIGFDGERWQAVGEGGRGSGEAVSVTVKDSHIATEGGHAFGIIAQSIGGGGGLGGSIEGGFAGSTGGGGDSGRGGKVVVSQSGSVTASGTASTGILAQSAGPEGAGVVSVQVDGTVTGGSGPNANAVWVMQGQDNQLHIGSPGAVMAGPEGAAVRYTGAGNAASVLGIAVEGLMDGDVRCDQAGSAGCRIDVAEGGEIRGARIYEAAINNAGSLRPGSWGSFESLTVRGDYSQQASGEIVSQVDFVNLQASRLIIQGDADFDGHLRLEAGTLLPGRELAVLEVEGASRGRLDVTHSRIFDFSLRQSGSEHRLSVEAADFTRGNPALEHNQIGVAHYLQNIWDRGGSDALGRLFAVLHDAAGIGPDVYRDRLTDLSPGTALAPAAQMTAGMGHFLGAMMSCPLQAQAYAGMREQTCFWGQASRRNTDHDGGAGTPGFSFDTTTYQFGGQREFRPDWFVGGSVAYQDSRLKGDTGRVSGRGDAAFAGVVLKHQSGPWTISGALAGAYGSFDLSRALAFQDYNPPVKASPKVYSAGARLRVARQFPLNEQFYLKPQLDFDMTYTRMPGYTESGGALGLKVKGSDQVMLGLTPMIEFGGHIRLENDTLLRPFVYGGVSFLNKDSWETVSHLKGAPAGGPGMHASLPGDKVAGRFGAGVQLNSRSGWDIGLQYDGTVSKKVRSHAAQVRLSYRF